MIDRDLYNGKPIRTVLGSPSTGVTVYAKVYRTWSLSGVNSTNFFQMVDARTLTVGTPIYLVSEGFDYAVKDAAGSTLFTLLAGNTAKVVLVSNATQAGIWRWRVLVGFPSVGTLKARYRADLGVYDANVGGSLITVDATGIGRWEDQSGNGYHIIQATAGNRPLWKTNIINGRPVVRWDGSDDALRRTPFDITQWMGNSAKDIVIFSVHKTGATQNQRLMSCEDGGNLFSIRPPYGDGKIYFTAGSSSASINVSAPGGYVSSWRIEVYRRADTTMSIKSNGTSLLSTTVVGGSAGGVGALSMGGYDVGIENINADQGEFIVYAALSSVEEVSVLDYLRGFWGVY